MINRFGSGLEHRVGTRSGMGWDDAGTSDDSEQPSFHHSTAIDT